MKKNQIIRRRGTSLAAAALSLALVAPFAQPIAAPQSAAFAFAGTKGEAGQPNAQDNGVKYPGKNADGVYQTSVGERRYTVGDQPIKVDGAIESEVPDGSNNAIEGYVINQRNGNISVYPETDVPKPIPMEGVRIYAQWVERDGATSPIYTTTTNADGRYTIGMKPFVDALGKVRNFDADPLLPEGEKFRVWAENPDPDVFTQLYGPGQGKLFPLGNSGEFVGGMRNLVGSDRLLNAGFKFGEKPQNEVMHNLDASVENAPWKQPSVNAYGQVDGRVHWDLTRNSAMIGWNDFGYYDKADVPAKDVKVYGSYLSDYAVKTIYEEAEKDLGFRVPTASRSSLSRDEEAALQNWIKRKIAVEGKDKWIAETVETVTGADGSYVLQFKGTFGRAWDDRGYDDGAAVYSDLARDTGAEVTFPDGSKHKAYDLFNTVAPAADYGSWMHDISASGRGVKSLSKHINWNWLFVSTEDIDGVAAVTPFHTNAYTGKTNVSTDQTWFGVWNSVQAGRLANSNMFLYPDYTVFDVLEYDTQQNYAKPGDKAETFTSGLPTQFVEGLKYEIEWVNTNTGDVVHKCEAQAAKGDTTIDSCTLDTGNKELFPNGISETTTFAANLYPVNAETGERGNRIATDAFTVLVDWAPEYEKQEGKAGEPLNSGAPTFDRTDTDEVETLTAKELAEQDAKKEPTKFKLPETFAVPEGYTVEVNETTGDVSVTFPKDAAPGTTLDVPVKVTYADGTTATGTAPFAVAIETNTTVEPSYEDKVVVPGTPAESDPTFKKQDEDGTITEETVEAPEGSKFTIPEDFTAPEGYTATVDPESGKVTVEVDKSKLDGDSAEEIEVPVEVTYPDDSTDDATAKFELDTDGDGTPDSKDDDDDNDGISDEEEKDKGSNPKDKGSIPATPIEPGNPTDAATLEPSYEDETGKPGEDVTVDAPTFTDKDGKDTTAPEGTKFTPGEDAPKDVKVDETTGEITVPVPEDAKPGDKITVPVEVTYPDETKDNVEVTVTVTEPDGTVPDTKDNESFEPSYEDKTVVPGEETTSTPTFTDKDGKDTKAPEGSKFAIPEEFKAPEGYDVTIDENTGVITVTAPEELDAETVEDFEVPVTVTYPDDTTDDATAKFELDTDGDGTPDSKDDDDDNDGISDEEEKEKGSNPKDKGSIPATPLVPGTTNPSVVTDKETVIEGQETDPFDTADNVPEGGKVEVDNLPGGLDVDPETGKVTGTPDKLDDWGKDEEERDVTVTVTITDADGNDAAKEDKVITVQRDTDGDGIPDVTDEDDDNDGVSDEEENKAGTDPKDPNSKPGAESDDTTPPTVNPIQPGDKEVSGEGDRPGEDITVTFPDGSTEETTTDENGDWSVEVPSDVELKPGDKVVVADGDGNDTTETVGDAEDTTAPTVDPVAPGDKEISGKGDRPNEEITVTFPDGSTVTTTTDENGDWKVNVPSDVELNPGDKVVVTDGAGNQADVTVEDTKAPSINEVKPGDKTVSGKGDRPNEEITVTFPGGKTVTTTTDENGNWKVNVPSGVELNTGDTVTATDAAGNKATAKVGIDAGKCAATAAGFGLPLLALIPIGLATQMQIPGVSDFVAQANAQIQAANTQIQQQAGLFNPQLAAQVDAVNQQLGKFGADLATVAGGLALVAAGILAGTLIYDNCSPDGGSSVKDLELKGSSGKTYAGSSKKEQDKAGASKEDSSSKQQEGSSEKK